MKQSLQHLLIPLGDGVRLEVERTAESVELHSRWQTIRTEHTARFGELYCLDGDAMVSTADEFMIHESLAHHVALEHTSPRRALILGGGDGGTARELLKHPCIDAIVIAELDERVVARVREALPTVSAGALDNPRVTLRLGDAGETLEASQQCGERFDLILFDLTASDDPACAHLHAPPFLNACADRLMPGGRLHVQLGSPFYQPEAVAALHRRLSAVFPYVRPALISVPLYGGPWLLAAASVEALPETSEAQLAQRLAERAIPPLRYYNPALHRASFALPNDVHALLTA
ncbi:MAG TPA: polyamine aminopropyltransferase [Rhodocyclaceae bacterium]|nr:polyamine aminopropyltransferase [Rhodocyclaceae bacterium]